MSYNSYFTTDRVVMDNYEKLTEGQIHALELDNFKPLDFSETIFNLEKDKEIIEQPTSSSEQKVAGEMTEVKEVGNTTATNSSYAKRPLRKSFTAPKNQEKEQKCGLQKSQSEGTYKKSTRTMSCNSYFMRGRVVTENYFKLSEEQKHALEIDIFKPLNFHEIKFDRSEVPDDGVKNITDATDTNPASAKYPFSMSNPATRNQEEERKDGLQLSSKDETSKRSARSLARNTYSLETVFGYHSVSRVVTENYFKLSEEERHALEIDIFKPLDFYEILFNRMRVRDNDEADKGKSYER